MKTYNKTNKHIFNMETDENRQSQLKYGTKEFPFAYYYDEINRYHGYAVEWHWHSGMEISFVIAGPVQCFIGNKVVELHSGDVIFINHNVIHRFASKDGGVISNFIFESDFISSIGSLIHDKYVLPVIASSVMYRKFDASSVERPALLNRLIHIQNEAEIQDEEWELHVKMLVQAVWGTMYKTLTDKDICEGNSTKNEPRIYARIQKMMDYIHNHYDENIGLIDIADSINVSKSEALRCFRSVLDTTPIIYLTEYRLSCAQKMLLKGEDSILEIALKSGFDSGSYFSKVFKKYIGLSPVEFTRKYSDRHNIT